MKLTPAAATRTRSAPSPGAPGSSVSRRSTSGPPTSWTRIARAMASVDPLVRRQREELHEFLAGDQAVEQRGGLVVAVAGEALELGQLLVAQRAVEVERHRPPVGQPRAVRAPLPELPARDLRGGRILH